MRFILIFIVSTLSLCKPVATIQSDSKDLKKIIEAEVGKNAIVENNISKTFALAYFSQNRSVTYVVIQLTNLAVVLKGKIAQGSVTWHSDTQIEETIIPGIVKRDAKPGATSRIISLNDFIVNQK